MASTTIALACDLCGLTAHAPRHVDDDGRSHTICCGGCEQVFRLLVESGQFAEGADLTQSPIYQQCLAMGLIAKPDDESLNSASHLGRGAEERGGVGSASYRHEVDAPTAADSELAA